MFSFFSDALASAETTTAASAAGVGASLAGFVPLVLIFGVFYFLVIRPQQKKIREHKELVNSLKRGDKVVAAGGLFGTVEKVDSDNGYLFLEVASGVQIKALKTSVTEVLNKKHEKNNADASGAKKDKTTG
ncbi:sec translocon accessory complex subunit YajC [Anaplasma platys]|uniref:Sec translocon accessory complex subunit YajC n=1 Tax=Anaplasma platys TaxID=949 RepID=A0A858PZ42_9RICK|nr:preprotein translocase subunit YajC [Anaplasma platys]QJC27832.1 sec translocon accessory complex subunit YajC [Anaplasma platys]